MPQVKEKTKELVLARIKQITTSGQSREEKLQEVCEFLADSIDVFNWVGFYLVDANADRELVLGPYVGEETDHIRIPFGKGICGQAADTKETFIVQDVSKASNYLACSIHVKAEIVVPIMENETFVAELDIDSHTKDSITEGHQAMLEEICVILAEIF